MRATRSCLALKIPPPVIFILSALIIWLLSLLHHSPANSYALRYVLVGVLVLAGLYLGGTAVKSFRSDGTSIDPHKPEQATRLVTYGIYRHTRNPMYLGLACLLLAEVVYLASFPALFGLPLFMLYIHYFQILPEEAILENKFGKAYTSYCQHVRRWL